MTQYKASSSRAGLFQRSLTLSKILCLLAVTFPVLAAVGWSFDIVYLKAVLRGFPDMQPNTVLGLLLGALAILYSPPEGGQSRRRLVASGLAVLVLLLGALSLIEYALGWDFGIDRIFPMGDPSSIQPYPGRPSPQTAMNFSLLGTALLSFNLGYGYPYFAQTFILASAANALIVLTGYVFDTAPLYGFPIYTPAIGMAIHTALSFIALSVALLCRRPSAGMMTLITSDTRTGSLARKVMTALLITPPLVGMLTTLGVKLGWYDLSVSVSLFALLMVAIVIFATWRAARYAERVEFSDRVSRERLDLALDGADLATWDWNLKTGEVEFNARWTEMRGYQGDEVNHHETTWIEGIHPDDLKRVQDNIARHFAGKTFEYEDEYRVRSKDGSWIWILDRGKVFERDSDGNAIRMAGIESDITERKRLEADIRLAESKASGIVATSLDGIFCIGDDLKITLFNPGAEKIYGYASAEVVGRNFQILCPHDKEDGCCQVLESFFDRPETSWRLSEDNVPVFARRRDGQPFAADMAISKFEIGERRFLTVIVRDVSERTRNENEQKLLAEVGSLFASSLDIEETLKNISRHIVKNIADFCVIDIVEETGIVQRLVVSSRDSANDHVCENLANVPLDRMRKHLFYSVLSERRPLHIQKITQFDLESFAQSEENLAALQALNMSSLIVVPLLAHGKLLGGIALISSSSSRLYDERDLQFAQNVAARAALSIENARLYHETKRAVSAREDVLAVVSHDLQNLVSAVQMAADLLREPYAQGGERPESLVDVITNSSERMKHLVADLLDFGRLESGTFAVKSGPEDLRDVVKLVKDAMILQARAKKQSLSFKIPAGLPSISCEKNRLGQVFANLVGNALKFTPEGGSILVTASLSEGSVKITVTDSGPGISPKDLPKVFDKFWQARGTKHLGSGLGLVIAKGIVEAHGGKIWAESTPGQGSSFYFEVPIASIKQESDDIRTQSLVPYPLEGVKVLIVDDIDDIRLLLSQVLANAGAEVVDAGSVSEALELLGSCKPNVILTDIEMPGESGLDLIAKIKRLKIEKGIDIPVIAMTGHDRGRELKRIKDAGFDMLLSKAVNFRNITKAISEVSRKSRLLH